MKKVFVVLVVLLATVVMAETPAKEVKIDKDVISFSFLPPFADVATVEVAHITSEPYPLGMLSAVTRTARLSEENTIFFERKDGDVTGLLDRKDYVFTFHIAYYDVENNFLSDEEVEVIDKNISKVESLSTTPNSFALQPNYPNPFNPTTTITFGLDRPQEIYLAVYDLLGREVEVLARGVYQAGSYSVQWNGANQPSGVYLVRLRAGQRLQAIKITLQK